MVHRQAGEIAQAADGLRAQAQAVELVAVEFHLTVSPGQGALEALQLQQFQFFPVHGLKFGLAHVVTSVDSSQWSVVSWLAATVTSS